MVRHVSDSGLFLMFAFGIFILFFDVQKETLTEPSLPKSIVSKFKYNFRGAILNQRQLVVLTAATSAFLFTLPWRVISPLVFGGSKYSLSTGITLEAHQMWLPNSSSVIKFWGWTGMNWPCHIDGSECHKLQNLANSSGSSSTLLIHSVLAIFKHPISYLGNRWHYLSVNWIPSSSMKLPPFTIINSLVIPIIFLFAMIFAITNLTKSFWLVGGVWIIFLVGQVSQLAIIHFESRYFIPVRQLMLGFVLFVLMSRDQRRKRINSKNEVIEISE